MKNHHTPNLSFTLLKFRKYLPKYTHKIYIHTNASEPDANIHFWRRTLSRCKITKELVVQNTSRSRLHKNIRFANTILALSKHFHRYLQAPPLTACKIPLYKILHQQKKLTIVDNEWSNWRAVRYNTTAETLFISDIEQGETNTRIEFPSKEKHLVRFLRTQKNLKSICFKVALKLEYHHYLTTIEDHMNYLKHLKYIDLDLRLQVSGLSISRHRLPNLFKYIRLVRISEPPLYFLKLCNSGSELESFTNEWLQDPQSLPSLRRISIKMRNELPTKWKFFSNIQALHQLQDFTLGLHKPNISTLKSILDSLVLPEALISFTFKLFYFDLSQVVVDGPNSFEVTPFFKNFFKRMEEPKALETLKIQLTHTDFKSNYTGFIIGLCRHLKTLKELDVTVQELFPRISSLVIEDLKFDVMLKEIPSVLQGLNNLSLRAPNFCFRGIIENQIKLKNLESLEIIGNIDQEKNHEGLISFLKSVRSERIVIRGQTIEEEGTIRDMLNVFARMVKLKRLDLEFQSKTLEKNVIAMTIVENLRRDVKASINFGASGFILVEQMQMLMTNFKKGRRNAGLLIRGNYNQFTQESLSEKSSVFHRSSSIEN